MSLVVTFPAHKLHGPWCCDGGVADNCTACVLALCVVCGGAEASLPAECPGRKMTREEYEQVEAGLLDYTLVRGWHVPARRQRYECDAPSDTNPPAA